MALATAVDVADALGRDLTESENVDTLLEAASDLVVGYIRWTPDPVPPAVKRAVAEMVCAVLTKPATTVSDYAAGGYNAIRESATVRVGVESATTTGPWLTNALKQRLRPFRRAMLSVELAGEGS